MGGHGSGWNSKVFCEQRKVAWRACFKSMVVLVGQNQVIAPAACGGWRGQNWQAPGRARVLLLFRPQGPK